MAVIQLDQTLHSDFLRTKIRDIPLDKKTTQIFAPILASSSLEDLKENIKFLDTRRDWMSLLKFMNERNSGQNPFHNVSLSSVGFKCVFNQNYNHHASEMAIALGKELKNDSNFIFQIVAFWPNFIVNTNESIRNDRDIVLRAVKRNSGVFYCVSDRLKDDREVVMAAVKQNGYCLCSANERFKRDREIVLAGVKTSGHALLHSHESLRNDREIVEIAISHCWSFLCGAGAEICNDREIIMNAIKRNEQGSAFQFASRELKLDKKFVLEAIRYSKGYVIGSLLEESIKDKEFFSEILEIKEITSASLGFLATWIKDDKDLALLAVKYDGMIIKYIDEKLKKDKEIVFEAVKQNPKLIQHIDKTLKSDREFILKLAKNNPTIIQYLGKSFTKDQHFMSQVQEYSQL